MLILAQTDTTVGFLSTNPQLINAAKKRPLSQDVLLTLAHFANLKYRVPKIHRAMVRRAKKTTFALGTHKAFRIVHDTSPHHQFLARMGGLYSSSANLHQRRFDPVYAYDTCDLIIEDARGLYEAPPSRMLRLGRTKVKSLR